MASALSPGIFAVDGRLSNESGTPVCCSFGRPHWRDKGVYVAAMPVTTEAERQSLGICGQGNLQSVRNSKDWDAAVTDWCVKQIDTEGENRMQTFRKTVTHLRKECERRVMPKKVL